MCDKRNDSDQEHVPALPHWREALKAGAAPAIMSIFGGANSIAQAELPMVRRAGCSVKYAYQEFPRVRLVPLVQFSATGGWLRTQHGLQ